ncbi:MAG: prepilin-type N-terminal cleavage/methylation domain-containing protein [Sedimentisphaerales bacterium]|nr:prepilin-type N-terminal cleavage/methylation domain-containing protein [Sedimentisphaerales bacterium]
MNIKLNKSGLTLLEILISVVIITILAGSIYIVGKNLDERSKEKLTESTIDTLCGALEQYHDFYGRFPFVANAGYNDANLATDLNGFIAAGAGVHQGDYSSSEALYYFLNKAPAAKKLVETIDRSLLTSKDRNGTDLIFTMPITPLITEDYLLVRIIDPWEMALRYTYAAGDNFPIITSAGPDRVFDDADDISSK